MSSEEVIQLINTFNVKDRLLIVEEILRTIRKENSAQTEIKHPQQAKDGQSILNLAGIMDEEEANVFTRAVEESRTC